MSKDTSSYKASGLTHWGLFWELGLILAGLLLLLTQNWTYHSRSGLPLTAVKHTLRGKSPDVPGKGQERVTSSRKSSSRNTWKEESIDLLPILTLTACGTANQSTEWVFGPEQSSPEPCLPATVCLEAIPFQPGIPLAWCSQEKLCKRLSMDKTKEK